MGNATSWLAQSLCPEEQVIWVAAKSGDHDLLHQALAHLTPQKRFYIEWRDPLYGYSPLANASAQGHLQCVRALLQAGADVNARDIHGNTPLHLATKSGKSEVVCELLAMQAIDVHAKNSSRLQTALDIARHEYKTSESAHKYIQCIELLEQKLCIYTGWLNQRTDNLLSMASGLSGLHSWKKRYCMVLRTADPGVVEIDLFAMKDGERRPPCPSMELVYRVADGLQKSDDATWFSRQDFRFALHAFAKAGINRVSAPQMYEFAAMTQAELVVWKAFFTTLRLHSGGGDTASASDSAIASAFEPSERQDAFGLSMMTDTALPAPSAPSLASLESYGSPRATLAPDGVEIVQPLYSLSPSRHAAAAAASAPSRPPLDAHSDPGECVICFDGPQSAVCVPCGHNAICMDCAGELLDTTRLCPVCRVHVREVIKLFRV